jgi:predicted nucleic acid-binding protein
VKSFLDTSVLVSTFHLEHPQHQPSFELFIRCEKKDAGCGLHSLAEVYAILTGMRVPARRASGDQALLFIGNIRERFTIVGLDEQEYFQTLEASATAGLTGGAIYDSILGHCALKAGAETIYTWNTKDFLRLPAAIAGRVKTPDQAGTGI